MSISFVFAAIVGLYYIYWMESGKIPVKIEFPENYSVSDEKYLPDGRIVASKKGSKYHLEDCPGAKRIKEENKIWFKDEKEAKKAGYESAANCPGLN